MKTKSTSNMVIMIYDRLGFVEKELKEIKKIVTGNGRIGLMGRILRIEVVGSVLAFLITTGLLWKIFS